MLVTVENPIKIHHYAWSTEVTIIQDLQVIVELSYQNG